MNRFQCMFHSWCSLCMLSHTNTYNPFVGEYTDVCAKKFLFLSLSSCACKNMKCSIACAIVLVCFGAKFSDSQTCLPMHKKKTLIKRIRRTEQNAHEWERNMNKSETGICALELYMKSLRESSFFHNAMSHVETCKLWGYKTTTKTTVVQVHSWFLLLFFFIRSFFLNKVCSLRRCLVNVVRLFFIALLWL